jgi:hypothetical protein
MKVRIVVEAKVSADRKRCLESCGWLVWPNADSHQFCAAFGPMLKTDRNGYSLRCRACIRNEVKP